MKILVLSFYFPPDLSAGSFRTAALVNSFRNQVPVPTLIDVVTTLQNRYHSFTTEAPAAEKRAELSIFRITLPAHRSGLLDQSRAFLAFSRGAIHHASTQDYDIIFATSSRLMTAVLGAWIARKSNARLYLDIRDIFVDTIGDVFPATASLITKPFFSFIEKWAIKKADKVNLVSAGFLPYFKSRYPQQKFSIFTNGIDAEFLTTTFPQKPSVAENPIGPSTTVLYAGNLGEGQGLHSIIPELAKRMGPSIYFKIIGDGGRKNMLKTRLTQMGVTNVELLPPIKRDELIEEYRAADILFLHLNDLDAFKKVLPSKIFEYAASGKPIWAGVAGYSAKFIKSEITNASVFQPCDVDGAVASFELLTLEHQPRHTFASKYARTNISQMMAADIVALADDQH